jgi:transposase
MAPSVSALKASLRRAIRWIQAERLRMEKSIVEHLQEEPSLADEIRRLEAIPGIGKKTARLLVSELPRHFKNARAVAAWLSVVPQQCTSGTSVRNGSHLGFPGPSLRAKLYFPAICAMRCDARSKAFAERLRAAGKAKMSIVFAVLHKLVRTAFALLKTGAEYQPEHAVKLEASCSP